MQNIKSNEKRCFVIMPFGGHYDVCYKNVIREAVLSQNIIPIRGDDIYSTGEIAQEIFESISKSVILIADVTGKNPNVNYELGAAHALNKPVVIISQSIDDIPFDYRHRRSIIYNINDSNWEFNLKNKISKTIEDTFKNPIEDVWSNGENKLDTTISTFLLKTWQSSQGIISKESIFDCDELGNCKIYQNWEVQAKTDITHLYHEIYIDKPGKIEVKKVTDSLNGANLSCVIRSCTDSELRYFILFGDLKPSNGIISLSLEIEAQNYLSNLIDRGKGSSFHKNTRGTTISFLAKRETFIFPDTIFFKNVKALYKNHSDKTLNNQIVLPVKKDNRLFIYLDYSTNDLNSNEFGAELLI